jgi:serine phosphatase RsbU (regulator of sigma subunit)/tetratricopeptide (TPR) repeat protein
LNVKNISLRYFFLLQLLGMLAIGQSRKLDSLLALINSKAHDTTRANAMGDLCNVYLQRSNDSAIVFIPQMNAIAKKVSASTDSFLKKKGRNIEAAALSISANYNFLNSNTDEAIKLVQSALVIYEETGNATGKAICYNTFGNIYSNLNDYENAERYFLMIYNDRKKLSNQKVVGAACNNLGLIYAELGDVGKATSFYLEAFKIKESLKDFKGMGSTYNNLGLLYDGQKDFNKAISYYSRALELGLQANDKKSISVAYNNMGSAYFQNQQPEKGLQYFNEARKIREETNDKYGLSSTLSNLGDMYVTMADSAIQHGNKEEEKKYIALAEEHLQEALAIRKELKDRKGMSTTLNSLGSLMLLKKQYDKGIQLSLESYQLGSEIKIPVRIMNASHRLYTLYSKKGDTKNALKYLLRYTSVKDSIESEENKKDLFSKTLRYEYDKKSLADSLKNSVQRTRDQVLFDAKEEKQKHFTWSAIIVCGLLLGLLLITYRNYQNNKKINIKLKEQKTEVENKNLAIESQKEIIQVKNREILDSIQYAKRIQEAILPDTRILNSSFSESFILFKPKDIVSGDFYWIDKVEDNVYVSVVDCTGHGVPGAFISLLGYNILNRAVGEFHKEKPGEILQSMNKQLEEMLTRSSLHVKDGMDIALCRFVRTNTGYTLEFAGAHNPVWIIRDKTREAIGETLLQMNNEVLYELKANRQSIGGLTDKKPFEQMEVQLQKGDSIYLFSDGYADQFGGVKGKKFKYGQLRDLLLSIAGKDLQFQKKALEDSIEQWKGNLEQVDDVCVIGIRI